MSVLDFFRSRQADSVTGGKAAGGVCAALDVGSSKIACFIARTDQTVAGPRPRVVGVTLVLFVVFVAGTCARVRVRVSAAMAPGAAPLLPFR